MSVIWAKFANDFNEIGRTLTPSILVRIQVPQPIEFVALFTVSAIDRTDRLGEISRAVGQFVRPAFSYMSSTLVELRHKGLRSKTRRRPNPRARHLRPRKQFGCCRQCNLSWRRSDQCSGGMGICTPSFFRLGQEARLKQNKALCIRPVCQEHLAEIWKIQFLFRWPEPGIF